MAEHLHTFALVWWQLVNRVEKEEEEEGECRLGCGYLIIVLQHRIASHSIASDQVAQEEEEEEEKHMMEGLL